MRLFLYLFVSLAFFATAALSQTETPSWDTFKTEAESYQYSLDRSGIENFTCLMSADFYVNFAKFNNFDSSYYYPLRFIWTRDHESYFVLQPLPDMPDSTRRQTYSQIQQLKNLCTQIFVYWKRFAVKSPFDDIPDDAIVNFSPDTVGVDFKVDAAQGIISVNRTFTRGGQLGRVTISDTNKMRSIDYPYYQENSGKWINVGWASQTYENDTVVSGSSVSLEFTKVGEMYLPNKFKIMAQELKSAERQSFVDVYLKDFVLDEELEIVTEPAPADSTGPQ